MNAIGEQVSAAWWIMLHAPRLVDFIDVLLLSILIYELLVHLRHTRVSQTLKGVVVLIAATWLSDMIGMRTIHALLSWALNAGPVLLIVLFQPEIRRVLEELGNTSLIDLRGRNQQVEDVNKIISELVLALTRMARRRVGALIVLEQKTRLTDVIATGTAVDGKVSQPLLENIFEPNTPLHDGAVIIRGDRVISAACLLRLSDNASVSRDLGTRHRAGLGITEVTDATVFIVSEETGIISMARGGQLTRHLDENSLSQLLHELYDGEERESRVSMPRINIRQRRRAVRDEQQTDKKA